MSGGAGGFGTGGAGSEGDRSGDDDESEEGGDASEDEQLQGACNIHAGDHRTRGSLTCNMLVICEPKGS